MLPASLNRADRPFGRINKFDYICQIKLRKSNYL